MKLLFIVLILQGLSQTIEYSSLIYGMLEGARLVDKVSIGRCKNTSSREKRTITFENFLSDAITLSTSCKWQSSSEVLTNFKSNRQSVLKASEELTSFILSVLDRHSRAMKNDGVSIGQILEGKIASLSPYVLKFRFEGEMVLNKTEKTLPVAVFHGLGDCCCFSGMTEFTRYIAKEANTQAKCIEIGDGPTASWLMGMSLQVQTACANLKKISGYENGVNLIGLSQGGLLVRALAESCEVPIRKVISIGGPQMGLVKTPVCKTGYYCDIYQDAVNMGVYSKVPQYHMGPSGYYKDPTQYETYVEKSGFLAWINNEKEKNSTQFQKFVEIESLVLVMFNNDSVTEPKITQHFGYYKNGSKNILLGLNKTNDYVNDILGLKTLNELGKVFLESVEGDHLQLTSADIQRTVIPYLF